MTDGINAINGWNGSGWYTVALSTDGMASNDRIVRWCETRLGMEAMAHEALSYEPLGTRAWPQWLGDSVMGPDADRMNAYDSYYIETSDGVMVRTEYYPC